jgi:hypothetical protein
VELRRAARTRAAAATTGARPRSLILSSDPSRAQREPGRAGATRLCHYEASLLALRQE